MNGYLVVVQAPAYPLGANAFATESAFAAHLQELREELGVDRLLLAAPTYSDEQYAAGKSSMATLRCAEDGIELIPLHPVTSGRLSFWPKHAFKTLRSLHNAVSKADIVHSGLSDDLWRPTMLFANLLAKAHGKALLFVVDIDFRNDAKMFLHSGVWNWKQFLVTRILYDPWKLIQVYAAPSVAELVLFKSEKMVREVGRNRPNVKNFFDTVHSDSQCLSDEELKRRIEERRDTNVPFRLVHFGRLVPFKGLDRAVEAVHFANRAGARKVELHFIGNGECLDSLQKQVTDLRLQGTVFFHPAVPYGSDLFNQLATMDAQIATPVAEDTPRAAFDAMARGLPIVAFDTTYYQDLAALSQAVVTSPWLDSEALGYAIANLAMDPNRIAELMRSAVSFARNNTQKLWLERRVAWTKALAG